MFNDARKRFFMVSSATATALGALALGAGAVAGGMALSGGGDKKGPQAASMPATPTPEDAEGKAKEDMKRRRRIIESTGGKTILSNDYGTGAAGTAKTLLGE